jgi:hypothetical protein
MDEPKESYFWQVESSTVTNISRAGGITRIEYDGTVYPESGPVAGNPVPSDPDAPEQQPVGPHGRLWARRDARRSKPTTNEGEKPK